jgi:hypothetical protein
MRRWCCVLRRIPLVLLRAGLIGLAAVLLCVATAAANPIPVPKKQEAVLAAIEEGKSIPPRDRDRLVAVLANYGLTGVGAWGPRMVREDFSALVSFLTDAARPPRGLPDDVPGLFLAHANAREKKEMTAALREWLSPGVQSAPPRNGVRVIGPPEIVAAEIGDARDLARHWIGRLEGSVERLEPSDRERSWKLDGSDEPCSLRGTVTNTEGSPVEFANVLVGRKGVIVGGNGTFVLEEVPAGRCELRVQHISYGIVRRELWLAPGQDVELEIVLVDPWLY